jgi:SpoVK/Ycf46/Vps4 family AAA+-type ATPase
LHSARLETLATRLETRGNFYDLAVDELTRTELDNLLLRCRYREQLAALTQDGGEHSIGVRALFTGPSGTGKTLTARLLAATLGKDLYRVDLSATVNKYLGETEKNLEQAFGAAEDLDVILLLDEGDALMTSRTDVGSANDRYANLETNYLLQRIESFNGILLVTTNASDRIDKAFARRMEVVVRFNAPDELRRYEILSLQLGKHAIDDGWLQELAYRCLLTGGQFRNVVTHAQLLALEAKRALDAEHLYKALQREYRKTGAHCPLPPPRA